VSVDAVVVAVPPSVWSAIAFIDSRHKRLNLKPYAPALGPAAKFLSSVETRFWIRQGASPNGIDSRLGQTWEATENQTVADAKQQKIDLSVFVGGPFVAPSRNHYVRQLSALFGRAYEKQLVKSELVVWPEQPHIRTGYSYGALGQATTTSKRLFYPVPEFNGLLHFAGEHTCVDFIGFMEGALQSGLRAARQIIVASSTIAPRPTPKEAAPAPTMLYRTTASASSRRDVACGRANASLCGNVIDDSVSSSLPIARSRTTERGDSAPESHKRPASSNHTSHASMTAPIVVVVVSSLALSPSFSARKSSH
jgi:hypothetical protein